MKTPNRWLIGAFVVLTAGIVDVVAAAGIDRARATIESQARALAQAVQRGDAAAMANLFTVDAKLSVPGPQGIVAGRAAIQEFWQVALNSGMKGLALTTTELAGAGEWRFETGRYSARGANDAELGSGEYLLVWKKEAGDWKIHLDYGHPDAPATMSPARRDVPAKDGSGFPANYQSEFAALGVAFNERSAEITATFANATAASVERAGQLPYPEGTMFVMEFANPRRDGEGQLLRDPAGQVVKGEILHVDVMRKSRAAGERSADPHAAGWEFASYRADGGIAIAPANAAHCADCHRNAGGEKDFVFRLRAPLAR
jgi:ketosteroid isomerase-like protein